MTNCFEFHHLIGDIWGELEALYRNREAKAKDIGPMTGFTGSSLGRAITEARDAHLSTFIRVAGALGYEIQITLVPEGNVDSDHDRVVTLPKKSATLD